LTAELATTRWVVGVVVLGASKEEKEVEVEAAVVEE
jgi:hypothetical protein